VPRRLTRDTQHAVLGGVARRFGQYLQVDPVLARLAFVLLAFVNGLGILFYLVCWLLMPRADAAGASHPRRNGCHCGIREPARGRLPDRGRGAPGRPRPGLRPAGDRLGPDRRRRPPPPHNLGWLHWPHWMRFETLWPLLLVALGVGLVLKSRRPASA